MQQTRKKHPAYILNYPAYISAIFLFRSFRVSFVSCFVHFMFRAFPVFSCFVLSMVVCLKYVFDYHTIFCRCECFDYLFEMAVQMKLHGIDPSEKPAGAVV